jgi:hypothetical protein
MGKFVKVSFASARKEARVSEVSKAVERDLAWNWFLLGNSSYLNRDVWIKCGVIPNIDKQIIVFILWFASLCSCSPICLSN